MSWSYQSNSSPCSVLVKEKQDGQGGCPPPILHSSSTETVASSQDQPEISSSLGNSVGGKKRKKRQAHDDVDVVFDGVGHDEQNKPREIVDKRILVNISIVLDGGTGSTKQEIYKFQVAVPLPKDKMQSDFYTYNFGNFEEFSNSSSTAETQQTSDSDSFSTQSTDESSTTVTETVSTEGLKTNLNEKGKLMENDEA
jgi:hypothetical protein